MQFPSCSRFESETVKGGLVYTTLNEVEMKLMKASCSLAAEALLLVGSILHEGMTTLELDCVINEFIVNHGAYPSPLNYHGFPRSICTSRNNVMCHGIPHSKERLAAGDIINVDISTYFPVQNGFHGDTSAMFYIGPPSAESRKLVEVTRECLSKGMDAVRPGAWTGDIGEAIQRHAEDNGFAVAEDFVGHGVGRVFHGEPQIRHSGKKGSGVLITEGMIFTVEPIINQGTGEYKILKEDDWTVLTKDGKLSAQFEHTILVTESGYDILTARPGVLCHSEDL